MDLEDQLMEIRFYVPPSKLTGGEETDYDAIKQAFSSISELNSSADMNALYTFTDLKVLSPAGRFNIQVYQKSIKLVGKSNDFVIELSDIIRMYLLPSFSAPHMNFILSLSSPIRKGHTSYYNVIIQFSSRNLVNIPQYDDNKGLYEFIIKKVNQQENQAKKSHAIASPEGDENIEKDSESTISQIEEYTLTEYMLEYLIGISTTKSTEFLSSSGQSCIRLSYKAENGTLYPLEDALIFLPKPITILNNTDIVSVNFGRAHASQTKLFEFEISLNSGQVISFNSVDRQEYTPLIEYLKKKKITVHSFTENSGDKISNTKSSIYEMDSNDEDFDVSEISDDEEYESSA